MKEKNPHQTIKKEQVLLRYAYPDKELRVLAETLANHVEQKKTLEDEKKAITADYGAKIKEKDALISGLSSRISSGFEMKPTMCVVLIDKEVGLKRYYAQDVDTEKLAEAEVLKEEPLPAGYQIDIADKFLDEVAETGDPAVDIVINENEKPVVPGDALADVKSGKTEKPAKTNDQVNPLGEDGLLDWERYVEVTELPLNHEEEPDSKDVKDFQRWLIWLQFLISSANSFLGKSEKFVPPVEYLREFQKHALNRLKNWAINVIVTQGGKLLDEGSKIAGPPDLLTDWELNQMKPTSKAEILLDEAQKISWEVWHLIPKRSFIKDENFKLAELTEGSLRKLKEWSEETSRLESIGEKYDPLDFPRLRKRKTAEVVE